MRSRDRRELTERNQKMLTMQREGRTLREIAEHFGVSDVRVHLIVHRERERQEFELAHILLPVIA